MLGSNLLFSGASYDPHANVAELMFGEAALAGRHVTNTITDINDVSIVTDENGTDRSMRVANQRGQTLLILS
jgi:hypothetical protein